jgi:DNA-binding protein HU-beta
MAKTTAKVTATAKGGKAKVKKSYTKNELIQLIADQVGELVSRKQVKQVLEVLQSIGHKQLAKGADFTIPGFAKFSVVDRKPQAERPGVNPQTGEPITLRAQPKRRVVKARPVKACKDVVRSS